MKFGVVIFPGSNCDRDMVHALQDMGKEVTTIWHKDSDISSFTTDDCIVLPGGFSFGDYLRCGSIARFSPVMESVVRFANKGGRVIGICNGFQILCESGLLPGALLQNANNKFVCKNIFIRSERSGRIYQIPIAHGEGRYFIDPRGLEDLKRNNQVLFRYCNKNGDVHEDFVPNGSLNGIAGICNREGNVIGMMPHPERACNPLLRNLAGRDLFNELLSMNQLQPA